MTRTAARPFPPVLAPGQSVRALWLSCVALVAAACFGPKIVRDPISSTENSRVQLRRTVAKGVPVDRGYAHPATISDVRLAHVLANLEHEDKEGKRQPTIPSELVYELAEAVNKAALKATPADDIGVVVFTETSRMGLFKSRRVTSFRTYFTKADLVFDFYDIDRPLEASEGRAAREEYVIPLEEPVTTSAFRMLASQGQATEGRQKLRVDWRDPYFAKPVALSVREGRFKRRTVISEAAPPTAAQPAGAEPALGADPSIRDAQIRALDQLDAARRSGLVTEQEFQKRRRLILEGKLEEAGYGPSTP